jgi:hypothetical protein
LCRFIEKVVAGEAHINGTELRREKSVLLIQGIKGTLSVPLE